MKWLTFFIIVLYVGIMHAQDKKVVKVLILNSKNKPLEGAHVYIGKKTSLYVADSLGFALIHTINEADNVIKVSYLGYVSQEKIIHKSKEDTATVIFRLIPAYTMLNEIVVSESLSVNHTRSGIINTHKLSRKSIEQLSSPYTIIDVLHQVNGLNEVIACGVCGTNSISIRGLSGSYTLLMIDGVSVYGGLASVYSLNGIPVNMIESIEITKGASSTLYGSGAIAGVLNVSTISTNKMPFLSVDLNFNSFNQKNINLLTGFKSYSGSILIGINNLDLHNYIDRNKDGFSDIVNIDRRSLFLKFDFNRNRNKQHAFFVRYLFEDRRNGVKEYLKNNFYRQIRGNTSVYGESIYTRRLELTGMYELPFIQKDIRFDYSFSSHLQDSYYGNNLFYAKQTMFVTNIFWNLKYKKNNLKIGMSYNISNYDDNTSLTQTTDELDIVNTPLLVAFPGLFVQDEILVSEKLSLLIGGRVDYYKLHGGVLSPQLNIKYVPIEKLLFRVHAGTGFKIVNLFAEEHAFVNGQRKLIITDNLNPEQSYNLSFSTMYYYKLFKKVNNIEVDFYKIYFTNKIIPDYSTPGYIIYSNTKNDAVSEGVEINVNQELSTILALTLGGNIQNAFERNYDSVSNKSYLPYSTKYSAQSSVKLFLFKSKLTLSYSWKYTGPTHMPEVFAISNSGEIIEARNLLTSPFQQHNIEFKYIYSSTISFSFGIQNIFDFTQPELPLTGFNDINYPPGFSPFFDTSYNYATLTGRRFYIGIKWELSKEKK